jgi:hypothetical protein
MIFFIQQNEPTFYSKFQLNRIIPERNESSDTPISSKEGNVVEQDVDHQDRVVEAYDDLQDNSSKADELQCRSGKQNKLKRF